MITWYPENPFGSPQRQMGYHEAGHAVIGEVLFPGLVRKIRMNVTRTGGGLVEPDKQRLNASPAKIWGTQGLVPATPNDDNQHWLAAAAVFMAGMAAESVIGSGRFQVAGDDIRNLSEALTGWGHAALDPEDADIGQKLFATWPYAEGYRGAISVLTLVKAPWCRVAAWLMQTDTLQGDEVRALVAGQEIRGKPTPAAP